MSTLHRHNYFNESGQCNTKNWNFASIHDKQRAYVDFQLNLFVFSWNVNEYACCCVVNNSKLIEHNSYSSQSTSNMVTQKRTCSFSINNIFAYDLLVLIPEHTHVKSHQTYKILMTPMKHGRFAEISLKHSFACPSKPNVSKSFTRVHQMGSNYKNTIVLGQWFISTLAFE